MTMEKNRKKIILAIFAIVMVCSLIIAGTLAWLRYRTDPAVNTFTLGSGVNIELKEEKYEKDEKKNDFTPGMVIDKDPTVYVPDSVQMEEYIAVTVRYYIEKVDDNGQKIELMEVSYGDFKKNYAKIHSFCNNTGDSANVDGNRSVPTEQEENYRLAEGIRNGWVTENNNVFYYGSGTGNSLQLTPVVSGSSITLFDKVVINDSYPHTYTTGGVYNLFQGNSNIGTKNVAKGQLEGFRIDICAYAVQGNITSEEGKEALDSLMGIGG